MSDTIKIPLDLLVAMFEEWKYSHGKNIIIIRSTAAIASMISSAFLIWVIFQSKDRLATPYHRLLLGMSISDFLFSLSLAHFARMCPAELSYIVWNAHGSQMTCDAMGFLTWVGVGTGLLYLCSLNIYFLVKVKYNKTDDYVRAKIEPFLHSVPVVMALIFSINNLVGHHYNDDGGGICHIPVYDPPHCTGYEDGQVPEGFEIPCGRGHDGTIFTYGVKLIAIGVVPITLSVCLGLIYRFVSKQETNNARYGVSSSNSNPPQTPTDNATDSRCLISWLPSLIKRVRNLTSSRSSRGNSCSRAVAQKALAYSLTYPLAWGWGVTLNIFTLAGVWDSNRLEMPKSQLALLYLATLFNPLQGLFTFLIYMYPHVMKAKRNGDNISLCQAFFVALRSSLTGSRKNSLANEGRSNQSRCFNMKWRKYTWKKNAPDFRRGNTASCTESANRNVSMASNSQAKGLVPDEEISHPSCEQSFNIEEEKTEIQAPLDSSDS